MDIFTTPPLPTAEEAVADVQATGGGENASSAANFSVGQPEECMVMPDDSKVRDVSYSKEREVKSAAAFVFVFGPRGREEELGDGEEGRGLENLRRAVAAAGCEKGGGGREKYRPRRENGIA